MPRKSSKFAFKKDVKVPPILFEISSDEEMDPIQAALASAAYSPFTSAAAFAKHSPTSSSKLRGNAKSVSGQAKRRLFMGAEHDIEDYGNLKTTRRRKKAKVAETLLERFRSKRGLLVSDVTKTEWCEKQMEFSLLNEEWKKNEGKRLCEECCSQKQTDMALVFGRGSKKNEAMKAGTDRHFQLLEEVLHPVKVEVKSCEDNMALKLINFINCVNQLLFEGLTRELPIVSFAFAEGIWMVGMIDEIRMPVAKRGHHNPILVETKTRVRDTVPSEPQKRNGRIQLMCYKYLWDNLVGDHYFPSREFFAYFKLNPRRTLCKDLQVASADSGFSARTLDDVVTCYQNTCKMLPRANDKLVLRYESQKDQSLLDEDKFVYDGGWLKKHIRNSLEFWLGQREPRFVDEEEQWKCGFCDFASECPAYTDTDSTEEDLSSDDSNC